MISKFKKVTPFMITLQNITYTQPPPPLPARPRSFEAIQQLISSTEPWVVLLEGTDGSGKTTLVSQCIDAAKDTFRVLHGICTPADQNIAYGAFRNIVNQLLECDQDNFFDPNFSDGQYRRLALSALEEASKIEEGRGIAVDSIPLTELLPLIAHIIPADMGRTARTSAMGDPRVLRENTEKLIVRLFTASNRPTLLVLENLHWLDHASLALLKNISKSCQSTGLLVTTRPLRSDAFVTDDFFGRQRLKMLRIGNLDTSVLGSIICSHLHLSSLPPPVLEFIAVRSRGNLFMGLQLAWLLADDGLLRVDTDTHAAVMPPKTASKLSVLPDSIERVTEARMKVFGRVHPKAMVTLKVCAVIGPVVPLCVLHAVYEADGLANELSDLMKVVCDAGYVAQTNPHTYVFTHIIYQECGYRMLPPKHRRLVHHRVAEYLETPVLLERRAGTLPLLSLHWLKAGVLLKAVNVMEEATESALSCGASREAALYLGTLSLVARHDEHNRDNAYRQALWEGMMGDALLQSGDDHGAQLRYEASLMLLGYGTGSETMANVAAGSGKIGTVINWLFKRDTGKTIPDAWTWSDRGEDEDGWGMGMSVGLGGEEEGKVDQEDVAAWSLDDIYDDDASDIKTVIDTGIHTFTVEDEIDGDAPATQTSTTPISTLPPYEYVMAPRRWPKTQQEARHVLCAARSCLGLAVLHSTHGRSSHAHQASTMALRLSEGVLQACGELGADVLLGSNDEHNEPRSLLASYAAVSACAGVTVRGRAMAGRCAARALQRTRIHTTHPHRSTALISAGAHLASNAQWDVALQSLYEARHHTGYLGDLARRDEAILHIALIRHLQGDLPALLSSLDDVCGVGDVRVVDDYSSLGLPSQHSGVDYATALLWSIAWRAAGLVAWPSPETVESGLSMLDDIERRSLPDCNTFLASFHAIRALAYLEVKAIPQAARSAQTAAALIKQASTHYWLVIGCSCVVEVYCRLLEVALVKEAKIDEEDEKDSEWWNDPVQCRVEADAMSVTLEKMAELFAIAEPSSLIWRGVLKSLSAMDSRSKTKGGSLRAAADAQMLIAKALQRAEELSMPRDEALAHYELGRLAPETDPQRGHHLESSRDLFGTRGADLALERLGGVVYFREI